MITDDKPLLVHYLKRHLWKIESGKVKTSHSIDVDLNIHFLHVVHVK